MNKRSGYSLTEFLVVFAVVTLLFVMVLCIKNTVSTKKPTNIKTHSIVRETISNEVGQHFVRVDYNALDTWVKNNPKVKIISMSSINKDDAYGLYHHLIVYEKIEE